MITWNSKNQKSSRWCAPGPLGGFTVPPRSLAMMSLISQAHDLTKKSRQPDFPYIEHCQLLLTLSHFDHMSKESILQAKRSGTLLQQKETNDIGIFITSRNGDRNMETLGIVNWLGLLWDKEMEQVQPFQININQSNACRKDWHSTFSMMS